MHTTEFNYVNFINLLSFLIVSVQRRIRYLHLLNLVFYFYSV